jgi:hypothetical protein
MMMESLNTPLILHFDGAADHEDALYDIRDWLENARLPGVTLEPVSSTPAPGTLGFGVGALAVVLNAGAVVAFVKSIYVWLKERHPETTVTIELPGIKISAASRVPDLDGIASLLERLLSEVKALLEVRGS